MGRPDRPTKCWHRHRDAYNGRDEKLSSELHWVILPMKRKHLRNVLLSGLILLGIPSNVFADLSRADRYAGHYDEVIVSVAPGTLPAALSKRVEPLAHLNATMRYPSILLTASRHLGSSYSNTHKFTAWSQISGSSAFGQWNSTTPSTQVSGTTQH